MSHIVGFIHRDAAGLSSRTTRGGTEVPDHTSAYVAEEFDGLGNNVGIKGDLSRPPHEGGPMPSPLDPVTFDSMDMGDCSVDGLYIPCSMLRRMGEAVGLQARFWNDETGFHYANFDFDRGLPGGYSMSIWIPDFNFRSSVRVLGENEESTEFVPPTPVGTWHSFSTLQQQTQRTDCYTYYQMIYENSDVQTYINEIWEATVASTRQVYEANQANSTAGAPEFAGVVTIAPDYTHTFWGAFAIKPTKGGFDISPVIAIARERATEAGYGSTILLEIHSHVPQPHISQAIGPYANEEERHWIVSWDPNRVTAHPSGQRASQQDHFRGGGISWVGIAVWGKGKFDLYGLSGRNSKERLKEMCVPYQKK